MAGARFLRSRRALYDAEAATPGYRRRGERLTDLAAIASSTAWIWAGTCASAPLIICAAAM